MIVQYKLFRDIYIWCFSTTKIYQFSNMISFELDKQINNFEKGLESK